MPLWVGRHTCIESVRVIVFAGGAKAHQTVICDFQNKTTVHNAVGRLEIPVAADVAVVQVVHSLVESSVKSGVKRGVGSLILVFFTHTAKHRREPTARPRHMEVIHLDKWMYGKGFEKKPPKKKEAASQGRCSHGGTAVKLLLIPLVRGGGHGGDWMYSCAILWKRWVRHPSKLHERLFSTEHYAMRGDISLECFVMREAQY